jgi:hypothetical protein
MRTAFLCIALAAAELTKVSLACSSYSAADISSAIQNCSDANSTLKDNSCNFGAAAISESGGNTCADNGNNYGVLQLTRSNLVPTGISPGEYKNMSMQDQVCIWARQVGNSNTSGAYQTLANNPTIGNTAVTSGILSACFQFGPVICRNDVATMQANGGTCPTRANGIQATAGTLANGTANLDGNYQSICSWGGNIQNQINQVAATCKNGGSNAGKGTQCPGNGTEPGEVISPQPGSAPVQLPYELS